METWTCPACDRRFGRRNQSHVCEPVVGYDDWFRGRPAHWRSIADAVIDHLATLGAIEVDGAEVGLLVKRRTTFVELRPFRRHHLRLSMIHGRPIESPRITRRVELSAQRMAHFVVLTAAADVDDEVRDWLTESYLDADR